MNMIKAWYLHVHIEQNRLIGLLQNNEEERTRQVYSVIDDDNLESRLSFA
ncbi:hypothetical protein A3Q56_08251 [Intoshia linei]|uniref:Uncharacterized protein n=1 Tax=Intoshia linei TaxID=1819745 RepID=A0A177APT8_9BILA|nr:hypothetical protein A3Q56_08251 [Intoshia linei]